MQITAIKFYQRNFQGRTRNTAQQTNKIQSANIRTQNSKQLTPIEKLVQTIEDDLKNNTIDELFRYHSFVTKILKENKGKNSGDFTDSKGVKYTCLHNFKTICVRQNYKGIPYDSNFHYRGYPDGKKPQPETQIGYIFPITDDYIEYRFSNYNINDKHAVVEAEIKNGEIIKLKTGKDAFSPTKIEYEFEGNKPRVARYVIYGTECDEKGAYAILDDDGKVEKIYYDTYYNFGTNTTKY